MKVVQQPSPWPCVVMLAALIVCCLAAPQYWQRDRSSNSPAAPDGAAIKHREIAAFSFRVLYAPIQSPVDLMPAPFDYGALSLGSLGGGANSDLLSLWSPPSIDELIAARSIYGEFEPIIEQRQEFTLPWSPCVGSVSKAATVETHTKHNINGAFVPPPPYVATKFARLGARFAEYSPANLVPALLSRFATAVADDVFAIDGTSSGSADRRAATSWIRLVAPGDRMAMRPAPARTVPWCVPQTLHDQLQRLAADPRTASWASNVSNLVRGLTDRAHPVGDDVQSVLAELSDAAQEAVRLADAAEDDRQRVELLRAHWALARRLDRWVAIHEEHVAYRVQNRVAARGKLSPYFDSAPAEPPTPAELVALSNNLEAYESSCDPRLAARIAAQQRALAASPASFDRAVAVAVEQHYRNANVRIAISGEMINRVIGGERAETRPVRDRIAGSFVRGQSAITARNRVELSRAEDAWQLQVRTNGTVNSNTQANSGPVRLRSRGETDFRGTKSIVVRPDGVQLLPSDVAAVSHNRLLDVTTDYDWLPLFGNYARNRALQEYRARRSRVQNETELRVSSTASETLDREIRDAVEQARQNLYTRFTEGFDQHGLKLETIEMKSTPERLVARLRVAGDDQLGSHTPRPRALSDSLASLQIHETALTNLAITLGLDGQRLTGAELQEKMRKQFPKMALREVPDGRRDTIFQFAATNAVQMHIKDSRLELIVAFDSVELDEESIPDVIVHANYTPQVDGLQARFARDGGLGIEGQFSAGERARLHNIFQSVLSPERTLSIVRLDETDNGNAATFAGLMITQIVLDDGWLGLAIGPESTDRVATRSRSVQ